MSKDKALVISIFHRGKSEGRNTHCGDMKPLLPWGESMELILDGSSEHGTHIWSKSGMAFGYIDRVVKSDIFYRKRRIYFKRAQHVLSYHLI